MVFIQGFLFRYFFAFTSMVFQKLALVVLSSALFASSLPGPFVRFDAESIQRPLQSTKARIQKVVSHEDGPPTFENKTIYEAIKGDPRYDFSRDSGRSRTESVARFTRLTRAIKFSDDIVDQLNDSSSRSVSMRITVLHLTNFAQLESPSSLHLIGRCASPTKIHSRICFVTAVTSCRRNQKCTTCRPPSMRMRNWLPWSLPMMTPKRSAAESSSGCLSALFFRIISFPARLALKSFPKCQPIRPTCLCVSPCTMSHSAYGWRVLSFLPARLSISTARWSVRTHRR